MKEFFTQNLLNWNVVSNKRIMPWKGEKDPYKIWLSEIILQQTRAEQGVTYYEKILQQFPSVGDLAAATDEEVFKLWEGLGYYTRCKNMLHSARKIAWELGGKFPDTHNEILKLKGVGGYTAAAVASFAFNLPHAVVDGNVYRVLARYFGMNIPIDSKKGKIVFQNLAQELLDKKNSSSYNQAIMDFGAIVCKPQLPDCQYCVLATKCESVKKGWVNILPFKSKKIERKTRWFYYFVYSIAGNYLVRKRTGKDIWQNLFEFYLYESTQEENWTDGTIEERVCKQIQTEAFTLKNISAAYSQQLTHQILKGKFIEVELKEMPPQLLNFQQVKYEDLKKMAFPKLITQYLKDRNCRVSEREIFSS